MKMDEELQRTFSVFLDKSGVVNLIYFEHGKDAQEDVAQAKMVKDAFEKIVSADSGKMYKLVVDVSRVSAWRYIPRQARAYYSEIVGDKQIERTAVYGSSLLLGVAATLIGQASGKKDAIKFFNNKEEALAWLGQ